MINAGLKNASKELFTQFLFRVNEICKFYKLKKEQVVIATFSNPTFMCGESFAEFRKWWLDQWSYKDGYLVNASIFQGCSNKWGVSFSIWTNSPSGKDYRKEFIHELVEEDGLSLKSIGQKTMYNVDGMAPVSKWISEQLKGKTVKCMGTTNGIKMRDTEARNCVARIIPGALGYCLQNGFRVQFNSTYVNLFSTSFSNAHGFSIMPENFDRICALYAARKVISCDWILDKDTYMIPDVDNLKYAEYLNDSYVVAMFDSCVTSVYGMINNKTYDYRNEFFPFAKSDVYKMLGKTMMKNEVNEQRFVLSSGKLSQLTREGQAVLDAFRDCLVASAGFRDEYNGIHTELCLDRWDASFYQLRSLFKETCPEELKAFKAAMKALKEKMRPMVYELGFLKK